MKKTLLLFLLIFSVTIFAQSENKQFVKSFSKVFVKENDKEQDKEIDVRVTFIFNYGGGTDLKEYFNDKTHIYKRISNVEKDKTKDNIEYQFMKVLDESGNEMAVVLYENGVLVLNYLDEKGELTNQRFTYIPE